MPASGPPQGAVRGYLAPGAAPDTLRILPPPPRAGSARQADDRAVFDATRALAGQPRWSLAVSDANLAQGPDLFSCALGAKLDSRSAPILTAIFRKVGADTIAVIDPPKDHYGRARPYTEPGETAAPVCVPKSEGLTKNPSYPSGHASISWTWGLILAELAPDRSTQILARARSIGDSRVICGVHYRSDIEAGRMTGASLVAALHGDSAFRSDMDRARAELAALRSGPHAAPSDCAVQDAAANHPPY
jgi:acid phosphatase (class A)